LILQLGKPHVECRSNTELREVHMAKEHLKKVAAHKPAAIVAQDETKNPTARSEAALQLARPAHWDRRYVDSRLKQFCLR
jgi:hypothetical protein